MSHLNLAWMRLSRYSSFKFLFSFKLSLTLLKLFGNNSLCTTFSLTSRNVAKMFPRSLQVPDNRVFHPAHNAVGDITDSWITMIMQKWRVLAAQFFLPGKQYSTANIRNTVGFPSFSLLLSYSFVAMLAVHVRAPGHGHASTVAWEKVLMISKSFTSEPTQCSEMPEPITGQQHQSNGTVTVRKGNKSPHKIFWNEGIGCAAVINFNHWYSKFCDYCRRFYIVQRSLRCQQR